MSTARDQLYEMAKASMLAALQQDFDERDKARRECERALKDAPKRKVKARRS